MNFDYSDEQKALKAEARRFLASLSPLAATRALLDAPEEGADLKLWGRIAEQGWCGTAIPEAYGGLGVGHVELCALAEEMGRALLPTPFASTVYQFAEAVMMAGSEAQKAALLPQIASGALIGTLAVSEGPGVAATLATRYADGAVTGIKLPVADGVVAGKAIVLADSDTGPGLYLVDLKGAGVTVESLSVLDPSRGAARLTFADAPAEPLDDGRDGLATLEKIENRAAVLIAFEQLGGAERCLEMARDYALDRYAFGRPIGGYQAIKHKLADVYVRVAIARANAYYGAWALSTDAPEMPIAAAQARIAASAAYWQASKEMIQTHGGIGVTWDADCHLYYRRARHLALLLGAPRVWKRKLVAALEQSA